MMKKYRLLKDTPTRKAGAIYKWDELHKEYCHCGEHEDYYKSIYPKEVVENNESWFEEVPEEKSAEELEVEELIQGVLVNLGTQGVKKFFPISKEDLTEAILERLKNNGHHIVQCKPPTKEEVEELAKDLLFLLGCRQPLIFWASNSLDSMTIQVDVNKAFTLRECLIEIADSVLSNFVRAKP